LKEFVTTKQLELGGERWMIAEDYDRQVFIMLWDDDATNYREERSGYNSFSVAEDALHELVAMRGGARYIAESLEKGAVIEPEPYRRARRLAMQLANFSGITEEIAAVLGKLGSGVPA